MSTAPTGWSAPYTTWAVTDGIDTTTMNRIEGNSNAIETGNRTIDPTQTPAGVVGTLRQFLDWFANRIKAITGGTNWYDAPARTIAELSALADAFTVSGACAAAADYSVDNAFIATQKITVSIPSMKSLVVNRARYYIEDTNTKLAVTVPIDILAFNYDNLAGGTFTAGDEITNTTQTGTGEILDVDGATLIIWHKTGTFANNDAFNNGAGVSADVDGAPVADTGYYPSWVSVDNTGDEEPASNNIIASNGTGGAVDQIVVIALYRTFDDNAVATLADGWTVTLGFEDYAGTTTTAGA